MKTKINDSNFIELISGTIININDIITIEVNENGFFLYLNNRTDSIKMDEDDYWFIRDVLKHKANSYQIVN